MHQRPLLQIPRHQEDVHHHRYSDQPLRHNFHLPALLGHSGLYAAELSKLGQPYACADRDLLIYVERDQEAELFLEYPHLLLSIRSPVNLGLPVHLPVRHQRAEMVH